MRNIIGNGGLAGVSFVSGSVAEYADLPTPASAYTGQFWLVRDGSGGLWSAFGAYKYPKGLYYPNDSDVWEVMPFNVKVAEDSSTLVNITNWTEYFGYAQDIGIGDRLLYNAVLYRNTTGTQTSTNPASDATNWTAV